VFVEEIEGFPVFPVFKRGEVPFPPFPQPIKFNVPLDGLELLCTFAPPLSGPRPGCGVGKHLTGGGVGYLPEQL